MNSIRTQKAGPFIHMVKRDSLSARRQWAIRVIALAGALLSGAVLILALGHNPLAVYRDMLAGALGTPTVRRETVKTAVPLLITAIGASLAFHMGFWNIGGEGQFLIGAVSAGYFAFFQYDCMPRPVLILAMMLAGMAGGGIFGMIPAFFQSKWGTNETLFTLMLNYLALSFVQYLQNGPWRAPQSQFPKMPMLAGQARLGKILGVHWGWVLALVLTAASYSYFKKTKYGYEAAVAGDSMDTARYGGIPVNFVILRTMFLSGALAGLAGMLQVAGADYTITEGTAGGVGFTAVTAAWMGNLNPLGVLAASVFIAVLERGSNKIQTTFKIPASAAEVLTGIILFFLLGCEFFMNYRLVRRGTKEENT